MPSVSELARQEAEQVEITDEHWSAPSDGRTVLWIVICAAVTVILTSFWIGVAVGRWA
jgi:hypothetical protein